MLELVPAFPPEAEPTLDALQAWVRDNFGIVYAEAQRDAFAQRVAAVCAAERLSVTGLHARVVGGDTGLTRRLGDEVSVNHTFFFREGETFEYLARVILPTLRAPEVRMWCAACSSGDEAYSVGIAASEFFGDSVAGRVRILGTDLSERQLRIAEQGRYRAHQLQAMSVERAQRWFSPTPDGCFDVAPSLRAITTFRRMNLTRRPFPFAQRFHLIFLRNVLYYFLPAERARVMDACFDAAEDGAWLVTSLTEPLFDVKTRWTPVQPAIYRKG